VLSESVDPESSTPDDALVSWVPVDPDCVGDSVRTSAVSAGFGSRGATFTCSVRSVHDAKKTNPINTNTGVNVVIFIKKYIKIK
jgi:hypothetical protein